MVAASGINCGRCAGTGRVTETYTEKQLDIARSLLPLPSDTALDVPCREVTRTRWRTCIYCHGTGKVT